jgi:NADPH:quinone reductase
MSTILVEAKSVVRRPSGQERSLSGHLRSPGGVAKLTYGNKVHVVYDGIGKLTFAASLDCLRPRGLLVSLGASSGAPDPVAVGTLNAKGSLFLTRPGLGSYATELGESHHRAEAVIDAVTAGVIKPMCWRVFSLSDAAAAHAALESGQSADAILLKPAAGN